MAIRCPHCGKKNLERGVVRETYVYKANKLKYDQPGLYCEDCNEGILDHSDMDATEPLIADFRAKIDGYLTTGEIRRIRKKLKLTQKQAAQFFGGGHNAFSRYESGLVRPPKSTDNLLRLLDKRPELLQELSKEAAA